MRVSLVCTAAPSATPHPAVTLAVADGEVSADVAEPTRTDGPPEGLDEVCSGCLVRVKIAARSIGYLLNVAACYGGTLDVSRLGRDGQLLLPTDPDPVYWSLRRLTGMS
jgi:hypothetical protein